MSLMFSMFELNSIQKIDLTENMWKQMTIKDHNESSF